MPHLTRSAASGARPAPVWGIVRTPAAVFCLGLLLVHLVLSPLLFSTATLGAFEYPKVALLTAVAIVLLALGLSVAVRPRDGARRASRERTGSPWYAVWRRPLLLGVSLFVLSAAASTALSVSPITSLVGAHESHAGLLTVLGYAAVFFATRAVCRNYADARLLLSGCVVAGAVAAAYAVVQFAGLDPIVWGEVSGLKEYLRPFGTMGHPNYLAAYLAMAFPVTACLAYRAAVRGRRGSCVVLGVVGLGMCAAVVLSVSRAAWLALAVGVAVLLVAAVWARRWRAAGAVVVLPVATGGILLAWAALGGEHTLLGAVGERIHHLGDPAGRREIWKTGLAIFREYPVFGSGLDTFQAVFGLKRTTAYWQLEWNLTPARAHNEVIHTLATQGLAGAAALLVMLAGLVVASVRAWRRAPAEARPLVLALVAGAAAFVTQSAFGFTVAACGVLFITLLGLLSRFGEGEAEPVTDLPLAHSWWGPAALGCGAVLAALVVGYNFWSAANATYGAVAGVVLLGTLLGTGWAVLSASCAGEAGCKHMEIEGASADAPPLGWWSAGWRYLARGAVWTGAAVVLIAVVGRPLEANMTCCRGDRVLREDPRRGVHLLARAVVLDPDRELHWTKLGAGAHTAGRMSRVPAERLELYRMARAALQRAVLLSPLNGYHHANLGHVTAILAREGGGEPAQAYAAYDRALELDRRNVNFYADAANAALGFGDRVRAHAYASQGTSLFPAFAPTLAQLGYLALADRQYTEAVHLLCRAVHGQWYDHEKLRPLALANLAMAYLNLGLFDHAVNAGTQALAKVEFVELRCNLGMALEQLGRPAEAASYYREVLARVPRHPKAQAGLRRLLDARSVTPESLLRPPAGN